MGPTAAKSKLMINYLFVDIVLVASRIVRDCGGVPQEVIPAAFQNGGQESRYVQRGRNLYPGQ